MTDALDAATRARCYAFFSRLFVTELDDAALALAKSPLGAELLQLEAPIDALPALAADFANVTIVNVVPYESFFTREDGQVEAGGKNPIAELMLAHGFEVDLARARAIAPDHIGIELELMATLCAREAEAAERDERAYAERAREVQRTVLREHLLRWTPLYFFAVERCAHTELYRAAARAAMQFLGADFEQLSRAVSA